MTARGSPPSAFSTPLRHAVSVHEMPDVESDADEVDPFVEDDADSPLSTGVDQDDGDANKDCLACGRSCSKGKSLVDPEADLPWGLPECRGVYCGECFPTWRLALKDEVKIVFLKAYLRDPDNKANFQLTLLAWVSLRREGVTRMKRGVLMTRLESLKFMLTALGIPTMPFIIRAMAQDVASPDLESDPFSWVTVRDAAGVETLGRFALADTAPSGSSVVDRPVGCLPLFLGCSLLRTSSAAQVRGVNDRRIEETNGTALEPASVVAYKPPKKDKTQLFFSLVESAVLVQLGKEDWHESVKQTHFTAHIAKVMAMKQETALLKSDSDALDSLAAYANGLTSLKTFIRNFLNSRMVKKPTLEKVLMLEPHLERSLQFLGDRTSVVPHPSLLALRCKTMFLQHFRECKNFDESLQHIVEHAGADGALDAETLAAMPPTERTSPNDFFRKLVFLGVQHIFDGMGLETDCDALAGIAEQFDTFILACNELGFEVDTLQQDLRSFSVYLMALVGGVSPRKARAAQAFLKQPRCTLFQLLIDETPQGKAMTAEVQCLLETAASDSLGDRRLQAALDTLGAAEMFTMVVRDEEAHFRNFDLVWDESIWGVMHNIIGHFLECRRIWSHARSDEVAATSGSVLSEHVKGVITSSHMAVLAKLTMLYADLFRSFDSAHVSICGSESFLAVQESLLAVKTQAQNNPWSLTSQTMFLKLYCTEALTWARDEKATFMQAVFDVSVAEDLERRLAALEHVGKVIDAIACFADPRICLPDTKSQQVWVDVAGDVGDTPTTFMIAAMQLVSATTRLEQDSVTELFGFGSQDYHSFRGHTEEVVAGPACAAADMLPLANIAQFISSTLISNGLVDYCCATLEASYKDLLEQVDTASELEGLRADAPPQQVDPCQPQLVSLHHLWHDGKVGSTRQAAIVFYGSTASQGRTAKLPCATVAGVWNNVAEAFAAMGIESVKGVPLLTSDSPVAPSALLAVTGLFADVNSILAALLYVDHVLGLEPSGSKKSSKCVLVDNGLSSGLRAAMEHLTTQTHAVLRKLTVVATLPETSILDGLDTRVSKERIEAWLTRVVNELPQLMVMISTKAMQELEVGLADSITFPKYSHIADDAVYSKELAKKYIVGFNRAEVLEKDVGKLYQGIFDISAIVKTWGCGALLKDCEAWTSSKKACGDAYASGKRFLSVRAAVNIAEGFVTTDVATTRALISKCALPGALAKVLEKNLAAKARESTNIVTFSKRDQAEAGLDDLGNSSIVPVAKAKSKTARKSR